MIKTLNRRVLVRPDPVEKETASGIILPDSTKQERPATGTVIYGNGEVSIDDRILFSKYGVDEFEYEGETLFIVSADAILARL